MTTTAYNKHLEARLEVVGYYNQSGGRHLIYRDALKPFADLLKHRIEDKRQNVVAVTGATGSGKSTFAVNLCRSMNRKWKIADNYIYDVNDLRAKLNNPDASPISLFDEGSISVNSNNSTRGDDKKIVALFDTMRSRGWTTIICAPRLTMINKRIRETHVNYMCMVPNRTLIKGFDNRGLIQIYEKRDTDWSEPYWKLIATTLFPDMTPDVKKAYEKIKLDHQLALIKDFIDGGEDL